VVDNSRSRRACQSDSRTQAVCNQNQNGNNSLMKQLQMVDFAIVETVLYLDAYPHSRAALSHYKKLVAERNKLSEALSRSSRPVTHRDNIVGEEWTWTDGPWPWENQAN